jgi:hypothetical protein
VKINPATTITHFLFLLLTMGCTTLHATPQRDLEQADALVRRLIPGVSAQIKTEILTGGQDRFEVESVDGKVVLRGNNANSIAVGLNHYLKQYCHCNVSWYADNPVEIPQILPEVSGKIAKDARCDNRFFINYCTFGYTMPWWQWRDWERFIDWMALNGVTMPLAITGQEAVWYRVWTSKSDPTSRDPRISLGTAWRTLTTGRVPFPNRGSPINWSFRRKSLIANASST